MAINTGNRFLVTVDVGNTNITIGLFLTDFLVNIENIGTDIPVNKQQALIKAVLTKNKVGKSNVQGVVISSVVPELNSRLKNIFVHLLDKQPVFVNAAKSGIKTKYKNINKLGTDRIINILSGRKLIDKSPVPLIVVDFGTTTTFDCADRYGTYLGGLIIPGMQSWLNSLNRYTSKLPLLSINDTGNSKPGLIGTDTESCIYSGLYNGYGSLVDGVLFQLQKELSKGINNPGQAKCHKSCCSRKTDCLDNVRILFTGGLAQKIINKITVPVQYIPDLILYGLKIYWENRRR